MNLTEATYLVRFLVKRRLTPAIVAQLDEEGFADYLVVVRRAHEDAPLDVGEIGQACWLWGFRMMLSPTNVLTFEKGPKLLEAPMEDPDEPIEAEAEELFADIGQPLWTPSYNDPIHDESSWTGEFKRNQGWRG